MAFSFGGEFAVRRTPEETYDFLTDPSRFCPLLPDYQKLEVRDAENFMVDVKVGIAHIRGTAVVKLHLAERIPPSRALYSGTATTAGGNVDLNARFDLRADGTGTVVSWKGEAQVFGRLTSIAGGLLEPLARKNIQKVVASLQKAIDGQENLTSETPRTQRTTEQSDSSTGTDELGVPR